MAGLKHAFGVQGEWSVRTWLFIWEHIKEPLFTDIKKFDPLITFLNGVMIPSPKGIETVPKDWGNTADAKATLLPEEISKIANRLAQPITLDVKTMETPEGEPSSSA